MKLTPEVILEAYKIGMFPMSESREDKEIHWYDPDPRGVLSIESLHVPRKLQKIIKKKPYRISFDKNFHEVIKSCAKPRVSSDETWINKEIMNLYIDLYKIGYGHSVEVWQEDILVGGLYGIAIGGAFFGESMFSIARNTSKIALVYLTARLWQRGFTLLDTQFLNDHLKQFGCHEIPRVEYHSRLKEAISKNVSFQNSYSPNKDFSLDLSVAGSSDEAVGFNCSESKALERSSSENLVEDSFLEVSAFLQSITQTS